VTVEKVHFVIRKLELEGRDSSGKEIEAKAGPIAVDLTGADLTGTVHSVSGSSIPAGSYTQLDMEIGDIEVTGMDGSTAFDFKTDITIEQEICGTFNVMADGMLSFTVNVDVASWFTDPADPTKQLSPTEANRKAIEENIERSFEVFEDDNHDGEDDDCECESADGGSSDGGSSDMMGRSTGDSETGGGCACSTACTPAPACQPLGGTCTVDMDCCGGGVPNATVGCRPALAPATGNTCQSLL
jgi:hypothetical protein